MRDRRVRVRPALAALLALGAAAAPSPARGAICGKPDLVDMVPPDGAMNVPLNARLGAHYATAAEYLGEDVVLIHPGGREQVLPATWSSTEQFLRVTPDPLEANSAYEIRWPALRGINAAAPGVGDQARFQTGLINDIAPPSFEGVTGLTWDLERTNDDCIDELVERYVFDIKLGAASDDGGTEGLTLMLFQTAGPQVMNKPTPIPARAWPKDGTVQVKLATAVGVGDVCFAGVVRDSIGNFSQGGDVEACVHTTTPPFFRGCSVTGAATGADALLASLVLMALLVRRRRAAEMKRQDAIT